MEEQEALALRRKHHPVVFAHAHPQINLLVLSRSLLDNMPLSYWATEEKERLRCGRRSNTPYTSINVVLR